MGASLSRLWTAPPCQAYWSLICWAALGDLGISGPWERQDYVLTLLLSVYLPLAHHFCFCVNTICLPLLSATFTPGHPHCAHTYIHILNQPHRQSQPGKG